MIISKNTINEYNASEDLITISDPSGKLIFANKKYCIISGYSLKELQSNGYKIVRDKYTPSFIYKNIWDTLLSGSSWTGLIKNIDKSGNVFILNTVINPLYSDNILTGYKSTSTEVTNFVAIYNTLNDASLNRISKIPNREIMLMEIDARTNKYLQMAIIDIDNFKYVNDYYGYKIGDEVIKCISDIILSHTENKPNIKVYHIAIDEFVIIHLINDDDIMNQDLCDISKEISNELDNKHMIVEHNTKINISASIGLAYGNDTFEIIKQADMALTYSKENHLPFTMFNKVAELREKLEQIVYWSFQIKQALSDNNVVPWLQPIVNNKTGEIIKFEALMRLKDETNNIVSPFKFLDISKKIKMYDRLSFMMINKTFEYFINNHDHFNINITWEDLKSDDIKDLIIHYLDLEPNLGARLTIEMVESESIENYELFYDFIKLMKSRNVSIALDDFGSGYSNFIYLEKLNIDYIKIDGSLIQGMMTNNNTLFIVEAIIKIAKKLKVKTVAEFVSSEEIYKKVKKLGIDYSQGFHFGKPRPTSW